MEDESTARIPREALHSQSDRLTNKHIQTLAFLQEIANENKVLKARVQELEENLSQCQDLHDFAKEGKKKIQDIQQSYMARADEINVMLSEKHRNEIMQIQEQRLDAEREMKEQMLKMRHEMEGLKAANKDLRETAQEDEDNDEAKKKLKQMSKNLQETEAENNELKEQVECLQSDLEVIQGKKTADMVQLRELRSENKRLEELSQELQQKNNELEFRLDKALSDLKEKANNQEQTDLIENLTEKMKKLSFDREAGEARQKQLENDMQIMQEQQGQLQDVNYQLQVELRNILTEYSQLATEHEKLRKRLQQDRSKSTFKDFVSLKRELNSMKSENDKLKSKSGSDMLLTLKEDPLPAQVLALPAVPPIKKKSTSKPANGNKMLAISLGNKSNQKS